MVVFPNAKINLGLYITAKRDDGYHNIETIMLPVDICDVLEILPSDEFNFEAMGFNIEGDVSSNSCVKAFSLLQQDYDIPPVKIILQKNIPTGAGMGGGSSDATFTLRLLNDLFDLKISNSKLKVYTDLLGSDCSFFIQNIPVFAKEKGNNMETIHSIISEYFITIVKPEICISTAWAYSQITPKTPNCFLKDVINKHPVREWKYYIHNDFEKPVFEKYPLLSEIKQALYKCGALYASMTGSGSAIYGIAEKPLPVEIPNAFIWSGELK